MKFLNSTISDLLQQNPDLSGFNIVLPGKRPIVFIRRILEEKNYSGFLPDFYTVEDLIREIAQKQEIKGISLWLFAFEVYSSLNSIPQDDFAGFLKWFPTLQKDWDDMLKFSGSDAEILQYMFDEERIKVWAENLGPDEDVPRRKYLNFWKNMNVFLPELKKKLQEKNWTTSGMIHEQARKGIKEFVQQTNRKFVFCGFNAFTPVEEMLVKELLQFDKAQVFFHADRYYMEDPRQEAGKFLREHKKWKEFNESRGFKWIWDEFSQEKSIKVYEAAGNITQTKILPEIIAELKADNADLSDTAVILLDENLLPASLDALSTVENLNITMGFPLRNLSFSNAVKHIFHLQKQLEKKDSSYYYNDVMLILEEIPAKESDDRIINSFKSFIEERNIVYISKSKLQEALSGLSYIQLLTKPESGNQFLKDFITFCNELKFYELDDIQYENVSHFEKSFKLILNQIEPYSFDIKMDTLETLVNQLVNSESIDFQGEPLQGLQIMGLLETRLLNFRNIIMLSVNEGKLPLGNSQNTYLPFDVRNHFGLHTYLENDSIYAYHFYRLLQEAENISLLYNALGSGVNTGEKSRFITQMEMESPHELEHIVIENTSEPVSEENIIIEKTDAVISELEKWKERVSATHLTSYLYNPVDFYLNKILHTRETSEIEEELSVRNYGNLVHYSLQVIYEELIGKVLSESDLEHSLKEIDHALEKAIENLKHQPEFYERGMNFIHKSIARKVVEDILKYDLELIRKGNKLRIIALESNFENVDFYLNDEQTDKVSFYGFIDRIDELNSEIRIIDYKTAKTADLKLSIEEKNIEKYLQGDAKKQAIQLCIYNYVAEKLPEFSGKRITNGIWSFAEVSRGVVPLEFKKGDLHDAMVSIRNLILDILNPEIPFEEKKKMEFS